MLQDEPTALRRTFTLRELSIVAPAVPGDVVGASEFVQWAAFHRSLAAQRRIDITDPMGRSEETYDRVAHLIDEQTRVVSDALNDAAERVRRDGCAS